MVYSTNTIVPIINPSPETRPGISIFRIIAFRIIAFNYCRSFVTLSCQGQTTIPSLEKLFIGKLHQRMVVIIFNTAADGRLIRTEISEHVADILVRQSPP